MFRYIIYINLNICLYIYIYIYIYRNMSYSLQPTQPWRNLRFQNVEGAFEERRDRNTGRPYSSGTQPGRAAVPYSTAVTKIHQDTLINSRSHFSVTLR